MAEQSIGDHIKEAEMILSDMHRPLEQRYQGAQTHAMMALVKMMRDKMARETD